MLRLLYLILLLGSMPFIAVCKDKKMLVSAEKSIYFSINNGTREEWTISPQVKPDRLVVECVQPRNTVKFITSIDSLVYTIEENDTIQFYVLYNGDSALTEIAGAPKNVHFTNEYIRTHKGKIEVAIPEVHELVNIAIALTDIGRQDSNMIDMETPYYQEVMKYFLPYKSHPLIDTINQQLDKLHSTAGYWYYYAWKMNACGYVFDKQNHIINTGVIRNMGFAEPANPLPAYTGLLEDFARKSDFRTFYKQHTQYYDSLVSLYHMMNPIDKMQGWLEKHFGKQYGNYAVYFSPLVGGAHSTKLFSDNGFSQTVMFVCRASVYKHRSRAVNEMLESRVVFTEIDHNFVNPVSDIYRQAIDENFVRAAWADTANYKTDGYGDAYAVFNEYMTWAIFSLYCIDNFEPKEWKAFLPTMESQMEESRGYTRFKAFNRKMMSLYDANRNITIDELYKNMLAWCKQYK